VIFKLRRRFQLARYLSGARQAPGLSPRIHKPPVGDDIENTFGAFNKFHPDARHFIQFLRQTGGRRAEVSRSAVINYYPHYTPLIIKEPLK
jgi:hypothetical protein